MGQIAVRASRPLAYALAPVLITQGVRVRRRTPVLPEAGGERHGVEGAGDRDALAVLLLGESTAAGVGVPAQSDGLARALAARLARHSGRPVSWRVAARTGSNARQALTGLLPQVPDESFDVVVVVLGVNDVLEMRSARAWQRDVAALVAALQGRLRPDGRIVLAGVPDLAGFPSLPQPTRAVLAMHARHLDLRLDRVAAAAPSTVHVPSPRIDSPDLYAEDGFHPSAAGYRMWADHLMNAATSAPTELSRRVRNTSA
ncbi:SGNH/GDSL hydrolase family protein [Catellatospora sichuanensis]|uniref:SGNH/GDSL hydrolase family protein n=1 Tax=Catellatospora sichuanensis TaxID=1969805 RepID=UPI0016434EF4|nr:SGNH/GDSL hydrolase family protein [Catellatospora sichuanensis]